jgi:ABC-type branched-subunit amino acid transport system ATPase component
MSDPAVERVREFEDAVLSARGVESGYGDLQVLDGVDLDVRSDEIVLVFGPNGAGKSTLLKTLYGLLPLWEGSIDLHGQDISGVEAEDMTTEGICYVPQVENVFPNLTVDENLDIGGIHAEDSEAARESMFDLFPRLADRRDQDAETLSGGERQMLAMARALMPDPDVLLVDEPSAGLAPQLVEGTFDHIERVRDAGTSVLVVEQNVKAALRVADRGYALDMGENRYEGTAEELLTADEVRDLYIGT